jgi:formate-nitrite transporter family protein
VVQARPRRHETSPAANRSGDGPKITKREVEDIEERSGPRTPGIYEFVRRLGGEKMARPVDIIGGTALFALIAYGQVMKEI